MLNTKQFSSLLILVLSFSTLLAQQQIDFALEREKIDSLMEYGYFEEADQALFDLEAGLENTSVLELDSVKLYFASNHALTQYRLGDCAQMLRYSKEELDLKRQIYGDANPYTLSSMRNLGVYYLNCDSTNIAVDVLSEAVRTHRDLIGRPDEIYVKALDDLAFAYGKLGALESAKESYDELIQLLQGSKGDFYFHVLENYSALLTTFEEYEAAALFYPELKDYMGGKKGNLQFLRDFYNVFVLTKDYVQAYSVASELADNCIANGEPCELAGLETRFYALSAARLAVLLSRYDAAGEYYQVSYDLFDDEPYTQVTILLEQADIFRTQGNSAQQLSSLNTSIEVHRKNDLQDSITYSSSLLQLGKLYTELGKFELADALYAGYLEELRSKTDKDPKELAVAYQALGNQRYLKQNFNDADAYFVKAKQTLEDANFTEEPEYASVLNSLGALNEAISDYEGAEANYRRALGLLAEGKSALRIALASNLANILLRTDAANDSILILYDQALGWQLESTGEQHPAYANLLANKGLYLQKNEEFEAAQESYTKALEVFRYTVGEDHPQFLSALSNVGLLQQRTGNLELAQQSMLEAKGLYEKYYSDLNPGYIRAMNNLANLYTELQEYAKAEDLFMRLAEIQVQEIRKSFTYLSESEKKNFVADKQKLLSNFKNYVVVRTMNEPGVLSPEVVKQWYNLELSTKGILLNSTKQVRNQIFGSDNEELKSLFSEWALARKQLADIQSLKNDAKVDLLLIDSLSQRVDALEKRLSRESAGFSDVFNQEVPTFSTIKSKLVQGEAAVEITRTEINKEGVYTALIVTADQEAPELIFIGKGADLEEKGFKGYKNGIAFKIEDTRSFPAFWSPIHRFLQTKSIEKIYYAPDGVYHKISLATLFNPESGDYILEELEVVQLTSTKDILTQKSLPEVKVQNALLVGFPTYNLAGASSDGGSSSLSRGTSMVGSVAELPGTEEEINEIQALIADAGGNSEVLMKEKASEEEVKRALNKELVHIATHGFFVDPDALSGVYQDPMLNSGLLFSGVSNDLSTGEDGILTAYEIMNLGLDKADIVVLSACETGLGEVSSGEGIYGLQRAFFVGGVNTVIMSLWKVDDAATKDLMINFYEEFLKKGDRRDAFAKAQKKIKKKYKSPIYWGAFVMLGG